MQLTHAFRGHGRTGKSHKRHAKLGFAFALVVILLVVVVVVVDDATISNENFLFTTDAVSQELFQLLLQELPQFRFSNILW